MVTSPSFWWHGKGGWQSLALAPLGLVYGHISGARMARGARHRVQLPVICIGNFVLGGAGKTPTALALARAAQAMGLKPGFLSRGYGGRLKRTTLVDPARHLAADVGDEPLLLAREAVTVISPRRAEGAEALRAAGVDLIIMDDGFQSARLAIDFALLVVDSRRGLGNGKVFPAGPLRAPLPRQLAAMDAVLQVGTADGAEPLVRKVARLGKPVLLGKVQPRPVDLKTSQVLAYCGIADPEKFHRTLRDMGANLAEIRAFGDHQPLTPRQMDDLLDTARRHKLQLVTTAKDFVRLKGGAGRATELAERSIVVEIDMVFDDPSAPKRIIEKAQARFRDAGKIL
ncbi:tetraacyldisaccharide 4'-kinase [Allorhizobium undicola]|uniref:tetraacyldisaccharide 4'-kinase n=1 Tax=Allorhizobium undicola TaxID=78527 RepID=UPI003D35217C